MGKQPDFEHDNIPNTLAAEAVGIIDRADAAITETRWRSAGEPLIISAPQGNIELAYIPVPDDGDLDGYAGGARMAFIGRRAGEAVPTQYVYTVDQYINSAGELTTWISRERQTLPSPMLRHNPDIYRDIFIVVGGPEHCASYVAGVSQRWYQPRKGEPRLVGNSPFETDGQISNTLYEASQAIKQIEDALMLLPA